MAYALMLAANALGDVVITKDGHEIKGRIESGATREIRMTVDNGTQVISVDQILSIQFDLPATGEAPTTAAAQTISAAATTPQSATLPAGTELSVRTIDAIDSKTADAYKEYAASLDEPVVVNGVTIIPAGSKAVFRVTDIQAAGFKRPASLSLLLIAVSIGGQRFAVETAKVGSQSGAQGKRTLAGAGIGAGAGALFGSLAGGTGAAVGAAVGAGIGTAVSKIVFAKHVKIPPETRFPFKLTQPAVIQYSVNQGFPQ